MFVFRIGVRVSNRSGCFAWEFVFYIDVGVGFFFVLLGMVLWNLFGVGLWCWFLALVYGVGVGVVRLCLSFVFSLGIWLPRCLAWVFEVSLRPTHYGTV